MEPRVFLVDHGVHRRGDTLRLASTEHWRKTFGERWIRITAPVGSKGS
jgi:hypothetical protein